MHWVSYPFLLFSSFSFFEMWKCDGTVANSWSSINVAHHEMYTILYGIVRNCNPDQGPRANDQGLTLSLFDTVRERDVDASAELFFSRPQKGSQEVRVLVK